MLDRQGCGISSSSSSRRPATEPGQLALATHPRVGQPDRRDQIAMRQHRQHAGVDAVGLAGKRREPFDLLGVGDEDIPAQLLQRVVHEPRTGHRLDHRPHPHAQPDPLDQAPQTVVVARTGELADHLSLVADQADIDPAPTEIQPSMQH
jgi:hypothetical protein